MRSGWWAESIVRIAALTHPVFGGLEEPQSYCTEQVITFDVSIEMRFDTQFPTKEASLMDTSLVALTVTLSEPQCVVLYPKPWCPFQLREPQVKVVIAPSVPLYNV